MQLFLRLSAISLLLLLNLAAQTNNVAKRLGYPADAKLLILHADDLAVAHSVDAASFDSLNSGAVSSASIMIPLNAIKNLKPGLTEIIVHLGHDDSELQAVMVDHEDFGAAWRQRDYNFVNSPQFKQALRDNHVILVQWKDLQKLAYPN